jgi:hypothetical protein
MREAIAGLHGKGLSGRSNGFVVATQTPECFGKVALYFNVLWSFLCGLFEDGHRFLQVVLPKQVNTFLIVCLFGAASRKDYDNCANCEPTDHDALLSGHESALYFVTNCLRTGYIWMKG